MSTSGGGEGKKEGGGEERALGGGADERNVVMDDDDMRYFLHFLHEAFGELGDNMFRFLLLLALCMLA